MGQDIYDLAWKHLNRHRNDRSEAIRAKMNRRFGIKDTDEAIEKVREVLRMVDPTHHNAVKPKLKPSPITGQRARWTIIDDYPEVIVHEH